MTNKNRLEENIDQLTNAWSIFVFSKNKKFSDSFSSNLSHTALKGYSIKFDYFSQTNNLLKELTKSDNKLVIHFNSSEYPQSELVDMIQKIRNTEAGKKAYIVVWSENPWDDLSDYFLQSENINDFQSNSNLQESRLSYIICTNIKNHEKFIELDFLKKNLEDKIAQRTEKLELALKKNSKVNAELLQHRKQIDKQNEEINIRNRELELSFKKSSKQHIMLQKALLLNEQQRNKLQEALEEIQTKNDILVSQNEEIISQRDQIEQQNEEIQSQCDMALNQRDKILEQQQEINDNIQYSSRIQQALFPPKDLIAQLLPEHFIFNKPKDIVSGDFYWVSQNRGKTIIAIGDCTGHGISGAMMSMLGTAFLNEIVNKNNITNTAQILEQLRERVISSLHQHISDTIEEPRDGMDIAICIIDIIDNTLEFSGANNSLYLFRNNDLIELKPDKMPIGIHEFFNEPFSTKNINLEKGDTIFLFSDGYADQFGGKHQKKLKYPKFKHILQELISLPLDERKIKLENHFECWRGENEQIDDVLVLGFEII